MFKQIWSTELSRLGYSAPEANTPEAERHINLCKLNLFIGPNNSEKSRAARIIFSSSENSLITKNPETQLISLYREIKSKPYPANTLPERIKQATQDKLKTIADIKKDLIEISNYTSDANNKNLSSSEVDSLRTYLDSKKPTEKLKQLAAPHKTEFQEKRIYIPILRGMRPLDTTTSKADHYLARTSADYFSHVDLKSADIITGQHLYELLAKNLLGQPE